ncbi:MAG: hypothetical protein AAFQ22_10440 [Pseudomonadota bacterium]
MTAETIAFMFVLAQIAGIYIGFGALISASKRSTATQQEAQILATIVYIGIMVVVGALLPLLLDRYGLNVDWSLRIGAIVLLAMAWVAILATWSKALEAIKTTPGLAAFFWVQEAAIQLPLILILVGAFSPNAEALYLTALVVSAFEAAQLLVGLVSAAPEGSKE